MIVAKLAAALGISERSAYRLVREGTVPATKVKRMALVTGLEVLF